MTGLIDREPSKNYMRYLDYTKKVGQLEHLKGKRQYIDYETLAYTKRLKAGWPGK